MQMAALVKTVWGSGGSGSRAGGTGCEDWAPGWSGDPREQTHSGGGVGGG